MTIQTIYIVRACISWRPPAKWSVLILASCLGVFHTVCSWQTSSAVAQPLIKFVNVANDAGITLVVDQAPPQTGAGMAVIDTDKDGLPDLILSGGFKLPVTLFRNLGGMKFQLVPGNVSGLGFFGTDSRGFAAGDYDNDGDRDLFVANWTSDENSALLRNDNGKFVDVTPSSGIVVAGNATGASWTDYDGDGCLDLYVSRYWWSENKLFKGNCTGEFIDNTSISGLATPAGTKNTTQSFQSVWFDADWDGDQDLYLMNDRCYVGMRRNEFFLNNGNGTFTEAAGEWGLDLCFDAMGIALTDFDGNGHLDMFMTNTQEGHVFAHASCDGYVDKAKDIGLLMHKWGWAVLTEDFNFDGWPDLYVANAGYAKPAVGGNVLFANKGDGSLTFVDMTDLADNADSPIGNTGLVRADFDADGDIDVIVGKVMAQPFSVLRNDSITGNYLTIRLQGTQSNRDGIGAVVDVIAGGRLRRQIRYESSVYNGSNDNSLVFGLGEIDKITRISIRWPSGTVQWIDEPAVNQILTVVESETPGAQSTFGLEICGDAYDNDCDGTADLEFGPVGSTCSVGVGECQTTSTLVCTADLLDMTCPIQAAAPVSGEIEADGLDNDCDGVIDEKEEEQPERPTPLRGRPVGDPLPPCANTFEKCGDGVDNDCDGLIDEGFGIGSQCQVIVGTCSLIGVTICAESGDATACKLANLQFGPELCGDEIDNDCDGEIDEGFDVGAPCVVQIHGCTLEGVFECTESGMSATCVILENNPSVELCGDGKDNDCDGEVDEGFHTGDLCASYVNDCLVAGEMRCSDNRLTEACDIGHFVPPAELCGDNIDNDCDGQTDEGFEVVGGKCWLGEGVCTRKGKWLCTADLLGYFCDAAVGTVSEEVMGDGFDNDCDGLIDENDSPNRLPTMYESLEVITDNHFVTKDIDHPQADSNDTTSTPGSGCNSGVVDGKYHQWMVFGLLVLILCLRRVGSKLLKFIC